MQCTNDIHVFFFFLNLNFMSSTNQHESSVICGYFPNFPNSLVCYNDRRSVRDLLIGNYKMKIAWLARFIQIILHFLFWTFHQRVLRVAYSHWFSLVTKCSIKCLIHNIIRVKQNICSISNAMCTCQNMQCYLKNTLLALNQLWSSSRWANESSQISQKELEESSYFEPQIKTFQQTYNSPPTQKMQHGATLQENKRSFRFVWLSFKIVMGMISFTNTTTLNRQYHYYWISTVKKDFEASKTRPTKFRKIVEFT